jgi:hypothetical protein
LSENRAQFDSVSNEFSASRLDLTETQRRHDKELQQREELIHFLKSYGYDGIEYQNEVEDSGTPSYMNLDPVVAEAVVKLGGFGPRRDVEGFMKEFVASTKQHPLGSSGRLYGNVAIDVEAFANGILLGDMNVASERNAGAGSAALKFLTGLADKYNVPITGTALAYEHTGGSNAQVDERLFKWYHRHGFEVQAHKMDDGMEGIDIEYQPRLIS